MIVVLLLLAAILSHWFIRAFISQPGHSMFTRSAISKTNLTQPESMTSKTKTTLSVSTPVLTEAEKLKRSRDDVADGHVKSLDELLLRMQNMFDNTNTKIETAVDSCKRDLQAEINTLRADVRKIQSECSSEIRRLSDSVMEIGVDVRTNKQRILVGEKRNDLLLSGVPYLAAEDLMGYVTSISSYLGYGADCIPHIYPKRLARTPIPAGATPPIVLQFSFKLARDEFYNRYLSSRDLSLSHLGFDVNKRIFINENLTEEARKIKALAIKLKKAGKLMSVYTRNGTVFIKACADAAVQPIYAEDQLQGLAE